MADFSLESTRVVLNGHAVTGWSDDGDALMLPQDIELAVAKFGADGRMTTVGTGQKGGEVKFTLLANSPSAKFFMNSVASILNGAIIEWNGSVTYPNGVTVTLTRGTLSTADFGQTLGKGDVRNLPFVWNFERVIPDYSAANF